MVEPPSKDQPPKSPGTRAFNVFVDGEYFQVDVDPVDGQPTAVVATPGAATAAPVRQPRPAAASPQPAAPPAAAEGAVVAPMPGMIIEYKVEAGDKVASGDVVLILEAMKMQNEITAERSGTVASLAYKDGDEVDKGDVLLVIEL